MTTIEVKMAKMETDIGHIKEQQSKFDDNFKELFRKIDALPDKFDKRYAGKLSEKIVYGLVGVILLAFATKLANMW